ncbi:MAG: type 1 glutamine amidotransferase [Rhodothermales bacterium]
MDVLIGITTSFNEDEQRLDRAYVEAVASTGAIPVILPMSVPDEVIDALVARLDGLVITGGPAIVQGLIGELPEDLGATDPARTAADERYLTRALERHLPILGICYGMQLLNARAGGRIYGDVERQQKTMVHSAKRGAKMHDIEIRPESVLHDILRRTNVSVNTRHIQALASVGEGYRVSATAPDGVIEAIERPDGRILGVQFHPEKMGAAMRPLFQHLTDRARAFSVDKATA